MPENPGATYVVDGAVATITFSRPEVSNSINLPTALALSAAVDAAGADDDVHVIVLRGDGPRFCAGGDASWFAAAEDSHAALLELAGVLDGALQRLALLPKPVVAAVQGAAAGAGLGVVLAADLVISTRSARFLTAYANIALTPDCGVSWLLPRTVGVHRALELTLAGRVLSADEAQEWGLVATVVDDDALDSAVHELVSRLAQASPFALGNAKRLIRSSLTVSRETSGDDEARTIARASLTTDAKAATARFAK